MCSTKFSYMLAHQHNNIEYCFTAGTLDTLHCLHFVTNCKYVTSLLKVNAYLFLNGKACGLVEQIIFIDDASLLLNKKAVLTHGEPRDAIVNFDTYLFLERHHTCGFPAIAWLCCWSCLQTAVNHLLKVIGPKY